MERKTKPCPVCGKEIYLHARVCPYCQAETEFVSVDEIRARQTAGMDDEKEPLSSQPTAALSEQEAIQAEPVPTPRVEPADLAGEKASVSSQNAPVYDEEEASPSWRQRLSSIWKKDKEIIKQEYSDKIARKYSGSTILIGSVIGLLSVIVLGIFIAVQFQNHKVYEIDSSVDGWAKQVLDSMDQEVSLRGTTIAMFPDKDRHYMLYLQNKYLHVFDAKNRVDEIFDLEDANARAVVDYTGSGVLNAYLSPNEKYVLVVASRAPGNTECGLYRIETATKIVQYIDRGRVTPDKEGYQVQSLGRVARYDANGERIAGMSGDEAERAMQQRQVTRTQREPSKTDEGKEVSAPAPSVTQQITPKVDLAPKPKVPEKITIKPVE
jgi:hypothetical protein